VLAGDLARDLTGCARSCYAVSRPGQKSADVTSPPRAVLAVANLLAGSAIPPGGAAKLRDRSGRCTDLVLEAEDAIAPDRAAQQRWRPPARPARENAGDGAPAATPQAASERLICRGNARRSPSNRHAHIGGYLRVTPASASYIVWLDSRPTARYAESERRGRVNRVRSVVADGSQDLGVIIELARHWQAG
jgi:hypothetical protein